MEYACEAPGPQVVSDSSSSETAPGISLKQNRGTRHTELRVTMMCMMCETSETCDADGYAGDLDDDTEFDGTYQVTGNLEPT